MKGSQPYILALSLGDGGLYKSQHHISYRYITHHSITQLPYVEWKLNLIRQWLDPTAEIILKLKQKFPSVMVRTKAHHRLNAAYKILYQEGKKYISDEVIEKLDKIPQLAVALLYMDDGSLKTRTRKNSGLQTYKELTIATYSTLEENNRVVAWLDKLTGCKFKVKNSIDMKPNQHILYLSGFNQIHQFLTYVEPVIRQVPVMHYKIRYDIYNRTYGNTNHKSEYNSQSIKT